MPNLIGQSLGRYHILEQLGEGGMAVVYKAYDTRLETDVAVKVIRTENLPQSGVERALKRFEREAKSLAKLTHPNIVPIIDYGEYEGSPYLVMKYLPGGTLKQCLGQPMPYQEAARLLAPIARALEYAHQHDIIHRDVKPSNILITESGQPMLSDFGVAKILEADETMDLTGTSMGVGTPEYMAPEQVTSKTADARADIYSLGVVFFELVTGRKPFMADTPMAVLFKQASEPLPRPRQFLPGLPEMVEKVLFKALAKRPEDRYQVAEAFAKELERLERSEMKGSWGDLEKEASKPRRMIWLMGGLIGLVVLAAGIGLGTLFRKPTVRTAPITKITSTSVLTTVNPFISSSTTAKQEIYANTESATVTIAASPTITPTLNSISILTPPPTLSPSDYGTLQYEDNFDLDTGTWSLDKGSTIQNGMLILEAGTSTSPFWNNNYSFSNFIFETSFKYINPVQTGYTGMSVYLRFSLNCNNGSTGNCDDQVGVSSNGVVLAWRQVSPNSTLQILSESSAAAFNPSGFNKLTIFVNGSEFRIFINDVFVRSFIDSTYKSGIIVMDETGSSAVAFDYVRIYALP